MQHNPQPGAIHWLTTKSHIPHPHVVIATADQHVTLVQITTNMNKSTIPGNIVLESGEGNLTKQSIVEVSKQLTIPSAELGDYIGTLNPTRILEIHQGISFIQKTFFAQPPQLL